MVAKTNFFTNRLYCLKARNKGIERPKYHGQVNSQHAERRNNSWSVGRAAVPARRHLFSPGDG